MVESTQWALLVPVVMLAVLGIVHVGVLLHGRNAVAQAALAGAEAQALAGASSESAQQVGTRIASDAGLRDVQVVVRRGDATVSVEVSATSPALLDLGRTRLSATATQPMERP